MIRKLNIFRAYRILCLTTLQPTLKVSFLNILKVLGLLISGLCVQDIEAYAFVDKTSNHTLLSDQRSQNLWAVSDRTFIDYADYVFDTRKNNKAKTAKHVNDQVAPSGIFTVPRYPTQWDGVKIIWVHSRNLRYFLGVWMPKIQSPFILISFGDDDAPYPLTAKTKGAGNWLRERKVNIAQAMNNPNLIAWFAVNNIGGAHLPKLHSIPIGIGYIIKENKEEVAAHVQESTLREIISTSMPTSNRKMRVFSDVHLTNNHSPRHHNFKSRAEIFEEIKDNPMIDFQDSFMDRTSQWKKRSQYMFSISQIGIGFDCYRTWESLLLGNIVLLQSSPIDSLFKNLPVVIIHDWSEITEDNLRLWAQKFSDASSNPKYREQLTSAYWIDQIEAVKQSYLEQQQAVRLKS